MEALFIILTASVIAVSCSVLGSFLILRKMAMVGDAISHSVLPGIVIAFLISGSRDSIPMLIGAAAVGVLTTVIIELLHKKARLQEDASIGVTFTWLFAIGVILITLFTQQVDLDQDCVLYGEIAYVPLDLIYTDGGLNLGPRALWVSGSLLLIILAVVIIGYKGLYLTSFNPDYAKALGISTIFWHFAFMSLVSLTTVVSFESVGAILVVALLITPAAAAYLLTGNLKKMILLSSIIGVLSAIGGYYLASWLDASIAGAMATVAGALFGLSFLISKVRSQRHIKVEKLEAS